MNKNFNKLLHPWYITGFADGESCFSVKVNKHPGFKLGWQVRAYFIIELHKKDINVLNKVQSFFGGAGEVKLSETRDSVIYSIRSIQDLKKVIDHFDNYPLLSQKRAD